MQQRRATWLVNARTERERTRERTRERKIDKRTDSQTHTNSLSLTHTQRRTKLNACVHQRASLCFVYHVASIWQLYIPQTHPHSHLNSTRHQHPPKPAPTPTPTRIPTCAPSVQLQAQTPNSNGDATPSPNGESREQDTTVGIGQYLWFFGVLPAASAMFPALVSAAQVVAYMYVCMCVCVIGGGRVLGERARPIALSYSRRL